eukprot:TRINITY_DN8547_c0_g1_i2.p1 TRINITY_DN8547_c0_g1~~TRINITY_DN8547_c0_g1_i2.p1  ORF type:complete len:1147 (+),score=180.38 TRINITY_DN8547_c0_g1_i2:51-3491(+)
MPRAIWAILLFMTAAHQVVLGSEVCDNELTSIETCDCSKCTEYNSTWLEGFCCRFKGIPATILAFEKASEWAPRLSEFNKCTGARVTLTYNGPDGKGNEDFMEQDLRNDVGVRYSTRGDAEFSAEGAGIYDAYITQAPWLPAVVDGLENLSPFIAANPELRWGDVNSALRQSVSFSSSVRALPLDADYVAVGWRQDVYDRYNMSPPETIQEMIQHSEFFNGKDHNADGEADWGFCLTPQVNYLMAMVAPVLQTTTTTCVENGVCNGQRTEQNIFFDASSMQPLLDNDAFRYALSLFDRLIQSSNCQDELQPVGSNPYAKGKCDRKTAFPTGKCAGLLSMPGTMNNLLLPDGSYTIEPRRFPNGTLEWYPSTAGGYWGRRIIFPGSNMVYDWDDGGLKPCTAELCPKAKSHSRQPNVLVNHAPFFAEGGESYSVRAAASDAKKTIMKEFFGWLSSLPVDILPLSGQYRRSQLETGAKTRLLASGWPEVVVNDLFKVLDFNFQDEEAAGNPAQDLLMLGFSDYMQELKQHIFDDYLLSSDRSGTSMQDAIQNTIDAYNRVTVGYGHVQQVERWRSSLNLAPKDRDAICEAIGPAAREYVECEEYFRSLLSTDTDLDNGTVAAIAIATIVALLVLAVFIVKKMQKDKLREEIYSQQTHRIVELIQEEIVARFGVDESRDAAFEALKVFPEDVEIGAKLGEGAFGIVNKGIIRLEGKEPQHVAVKRIHPSAQMTEQETFIYEARLLAMLEHENIIRIVGVQCETKPILILTELMSRGDLLTVLRDIKEGFFTEQELLHTCSCIADALAYLERRNIVHRDIACRNVLVSGHRLKKVCLNDFGMSRILGGGSEYYNKTSEEAVPIKWLALEAIEKRHYTHASDAWAWAVFVWEVFSYGTAPWAAYTAVEAVLAISKGERLPRPAPCPEELYELMLACWDLDPDFRPSFRDVSKFFRRGAHPTYTTNLSLAGALHGSGYRHISRDSLQNGGAASPVNEQYFGEGSVTSRTSCSSNYEYMQDAEGGQIFPDGYDGSVVAAASRAAAKARLGPSPLSATHANGYAKLSPGSAMFESLAEVDEPISPQASAPTHANGYAKLSAQPTTIDNNNDPAEQPVMPANAPIPSASRQIDAESGYSSSFAVVNIGSLHSTTI